MENYKKKSFAPLSGDSPTLLILGSIPGEKSLEIQQYYGHPQNRFWRVIATIYNNPLPTSYQEKRELLIANKIALWDVAETADRSGSLDSNIKNEEPNRLYDFLENHPSIKTIAFNGKKAQQMFDKFFKRDSRYMFLSLPSTSPANAVFSLEKLVDKWKIIQII